MKKLIFSLLTTALLCLSLPAFATGETEEPPEKPEKPLQGCTPGYWKNHPDAWVTFRPEWNLDTFEYFVLPPSLYGLMQNDTLMDILNYKGGPNYDGAARILLRHAMAAMLNYRSFDVNYGLDRAEIIPMVNDALASLDREEMLQVKAVLEFLNERGCPL